MTALIPPLTSLVFLILGSGLFNTFVSVRLEIEGFNPEQIGLVVSALYLGILVGSLRIDRWIRKNGHVQSLVHFSLISMIAVLLQSLAVDLWAWSILRFIGGICMAGVFIGIESWLLIQSSPKNRGMILSLYLGVFYAALSLGQFLINVSDPMGPLPFYITAALCAISIAPLYWKKVREPKLEEAARLSLVQIFRLSPHGFAGGVISGMVLAAIYGLVPVFAKEIGLSISEIGTLMAVIIFGGVSLQWPMGRLADKGDRRKILNWASFLSALLALAIVYIDHRSLPYLLIFAWGFGGCAFTLYPLSMAYTCEKVEENQIVAATGGFVLSYGIGAIAGPILAPIAMSWLGAVGLFYFLAAISLLLGLLGLKRPIALRVEENDQDTPK